MAERYDYVVIGAGSAGSALAARLSEDPSCSVLLLEAGGEDNHRWMPVPLGIGRMLQDERVAWQFSTEPEGHLKGQRLLWPRGKALGGSSSINGMIYVRGAARDYDRWRDMGCPGWGYDDVLATYKRQEHRPEGDPRYRGRGGPIEVTDVRHRDALSEGFYHACLEAGIPATADYNAEQYEGVSYLQLSTSRWARRCSTAVGYLRQARGRPNLEIRTETMVRKLLVEGNRAVGAAVFSANDSAPEPATHEVQANREVILCAGAIGSPQILELSGIGDTARLEDIDIAPVRHLPGVGENLTDHLQVRTSYECTRPITINDTLRSPLRGAMSGLQYMVMRRGLLATPAVTVHALARSGLDPDGPDLKIQLAHISGMDRFSYTKDLGVDAFPGFNIGVFRLHPSSRGSVHATSPDARQKPKIHANYLSTEDDVRTTLAGLKMCREIAGQAALSDLVVREVRPGPEVMDEDALLDYARECGQTSYHPIGTCKMGGDAMAVVDPALKVHGIVGLRVADASVLPLMISSNTNAPSILIGERCAELIRAER